VPPPSAASAVAPTAVRLGDLTHDRQPEPGSRFVARCRSAVEAVEDVFELLCRDSGAVVPHGHLAVADRDLDRRAVTAVLARVVEPP
jgi:hypothetical protein